MKTEKIRTQIYIPRILHSKFSYIAGIDGRSMSKEIELLIRREIKEYEKRNGKITDEQMIEARQEGLL